EIDGISACSESQSEICGNAVNAHVLKREQKTQRNAIRECRKQHRQHIWQSCRTEGECLDEGFTVHRFDEVCPEKTEYSPRTGREADHGERDGAPRRSGLQPNNG